VNRQTSRTDTGYTRSGTATFEDGTSATRNVEVARNDNGATRSSDQTFRNGATRSVDAVRTRTGQGEGTVTRTITNPQGETRTTNGTYTVGPPAPKN